jgi:putative flippase GtrA
VGQLVAESVRLYGRRFWRSLATGVGPALLVVGGAPLDRTERLVFVGTIGTLLVTASYVVACTLVTEPRPRRALATAFACGVLAFLPVPVLVTVFVLPALAWLALVGLVVPAALIEERRPRDAFARAIELARADYVHALGSLATLAIVVFLCQGVLFFLLRGAGESAIAIAAFLANLVVSPVIFLGSALLYFDQAARAAARRRDRVASSVS